MKTDFRDYLSGNTMIRLTKSTKSGIFTELINFVAELRAVNASDVFASVMAREKVMSTAVGEGVAIPHGRLADFGEPLIVIGICDAPVMDYIGMDGKPIKLVLMVMVDYCDSELHLELLRSIAGILLKDSELTANVVAAPNAVKMIEILHGNRRIMS